MTDRERLDALSPQLVLEDLPGARKSLPPRALLLSLAAFGAAVWGAFTHPAFLAGYDALSWLLVLVPAFLFAYYRGWRGATRALAVGTLAVLVLEATAEQALGMTPDWDLLLLVDVGLLGIGLGLGALSEFLLRERREALALAYSDPLTGLPNRQLVEEVLRRGFRGAMTADEPTLYVVLVDIDRFKRYNRKFGRRAGDTALHVIAECIDENKRRMDIVGRFDGDQFLAVLSGRTVDEALSFAERLREVIAGAKLPSGGALRVSAGVATFETWMREPWELLDCAERALARAKGVGGNRVVCETSSAIDSIWDDALEPRAASEDGSDAKPDAVIMPASESTPAETGPFDRIPVGLYRCSESRILAVNSDLVRMLGFASKESLTSVDPEEVHATPDDVSRWQGLLAGGVDLRDYNVLMRRQDGSLFWAKIQARCVGDEDDEGLFDVAVVDVSAEKRLETELRSTNEDLSRVNNELRRQLRRLRSEGTVAAPDRHAPSATHPDERDLDLEFESAFTEEIVRSVESATRPPGGEAASDDLDFTAWLEASEEILADDDSAARSADPPDGLELSGHASWRRISDGESARHAN